jgi:hypothetical protein
MKLFVDDARGRGHPLHVARTNFSPTTGGVPVFHFALIDDGDRLEPTMWMLADAAALVRRRELHRASVIEQEERTEHRPQVGVSKECPYGEPIANPVPVHAALDAAELLD